MHLDELDQKKEFFELSKYIVSFETQLVILNILLKNKSVLILLGEYLILSCKSL